MRHMIQQTTMHTYVRITSKFMGKNIYRDCQKSTGDKTWDASERRDRALGYHHRDHALCLVIIVKSSSKLSIVVHSHKAALLHNNYNMC